MKNLKDRQPTKEEEIEISIYIFIDQGKLRPWFGKIDGIDAIIISYIVNWKKSGNAETRYCKKGEYIWIGYKALLRQLPILNIKYTALRDRLGKLCDIGVFDRKFLYRANGNKATFYLVPDKFLKKDKGVKDDKKTGNKQRKTKSPAT